LTPSALGWFERIPGLEATSAYFLQGTFDVLDILAIATGTLAAYLTMLFLGGKEETNAVYR